jgi:putative serine protease PepD
MVDAEGKLIGINTLITSYSGNYSGVGFAIPVNYAVNLANQIIDGQTPTHAQLGVSLINVTPQMAQRYGLAVDEGAYIAAVSPDSGAAAAGLQEGDIVTAFDGQAVEGASDLMLDVRGKQPGDTVTLTIDRDGQSQDVQVVLGDDAASQQQQQQMPSRQQRYSYGYGQLDNAA